MSLAAAVAGAAAKRVPLYRHIADLAGTERVTLPLPAFNIINGGSHAGNKIAFQEFMILPTGAASYAHALTIGAEVYQHLKTIIKKKFGQDGTPRCPAAPLTRTAINVGDEGGFAPNIQSVYECLDLIMEALAAAGYAAVVKIGLDVAASGTMRGRGRGADRQSSTSRTVPDTTTSTQRTPPPPCRRLCPAASSPSSTST